MSIGLYKFVGIFEKIKPDLIILLETDMKFLQLVSRLLYVECPSVIYMEEKSLNH